MNFTAIVYSSKILSWIYCKLTQIEYPNFKREVERRATLDLFDYKNIAQPLPKCYFEICTDNNYFGIGNSIRNYIGSNEGYLKAFVEHGYFFGSYVQEMEKITFAKKIFTFSKVRKDIIEPVVDGKEVIPIGPYIHYAQDYYDSDKFAEVKKELGKTLLVFFSHSGTGESVCFDIDELIAKINSVRSKFQTVVVSLFWSDINPTIEKRLHEEGYLIFSSGHRYDYYFLSRQKTMIKLADVTMSNSLGTHLAYCTYFNKPHWIVRQNLSLKALNKKGQANISIAGKMGKSFETQQEELYGAFSEFQEELTAVQRNLCDRYFGFSNVKEKKEFKLIIGV